MKNRVVKKGIFTFVVMVFVLMLPVLSVEAKWVKENGKYRYTTNVSGTKYYKNKWVKIKGKYYYFDKNGYRKTGWLTYNGKKYYMNSKGIRVTGFQKIKKKQYYFSSKGVMVTGWMKYKNNYYYMDNNGVIQTGLKQIKNYIYYFDDTGRRVSDTTVSFGNMSYYFGSNGTLQFNGTEEENAVKYINVKRILNGYKPLEYWANSNLTSAALQRAKELESIPSHNRPNGFSYANVLEKEYPVSNYWSGECILWGNPKKGIAVAESWLGDANAAILLQKEADSIGIAKYSDAKGCEYWAAILIQKK